MSGGGLSFGLNLGKKKPVTSRGAPPKRKPATFGDDSDDEDNTNINGTAVEEIGELGGIELPSSSIASKKSSSKPPTKPPSGPKSKVSQPSQFGDLSTAFTSKKHAETAEALDESIYDYDAVFDSLKPKKTVTAEDRERKPKYMKSLLDAAALRKRDATIAEERRLAKEREAEGDEFADKEKFVTSAYKKQQEEARRLEAEEKEREEREAAENKKTGFTSFYKGMLEKDEQRHREIVEAAERAAKEGPKAADDEDEGLDETKLAKEINEKLGDKIAINEEGEVVDKRQLLKGGLNIIPKKKEVVAAAPKPSGPERQRDRGFSGIPGGKQAMRERQTRMMEAQLEAASKRAREEEEEEKVKIERESKSRKTEGEILSAKERYLQRKKAAEEAKKAAGEGV